MRRIAFTSAIALTLAVVPATVLAQDDATTMAPHPSHIHVGACPAPGEVIAPLSDVAAPAGDAMGSASAVPVELGVSTVDLALADILAAEHAFVVHASTDDMGTYLVCGDIGGVVGDSLAVGLAPVGGSGYSGIGSLTDNGDGTTDIVLAITQSGAAVSDDADDDDDDRDGDDGADDDDSDDDDDADDADDDDDDSDDDDADDDGDDDDD